MASLTILSAIDRLCGLVVHVVDPVFVGRLLGDGIALDPTTSTVRAPRAGEVTSVPAGGHAVSIRTSEGVDVLVHVGIDTVQLDGRGFQVLVKPGQTVTPGEELIRFDLDMVARAA